MKFFVVTLIFLACANTLPAQGKFFSWNGQREIIETENKENKIKELSKTNVSCGKYFVYREIEDQKVLSFKMLLAKADKNVSPYHHIGLDILIIRIDDKINVPTAEYLSPSQSGGFPKARFVIRMSKDDHKSANCLSGLQLTT